MKSGRARGLIFLRQLPASTYSCVDFWRELPDICGCQEAHHCFIALLHGEQLTYLHMSALACSPPSCFSDISAEDLLLIFPSAAVAEEMFPCLDCCPASATAQLAFVVVSVSELFQVRALRCMFRLQSVEPGGQRLHRVHWDNFLVSSFAFQLVMVMLTAFFGFPLSFHRCLCIRDSSGPVRHQYLLSLFYCASSAALSC